jgi:flagellar hook-associated protein 1 FlgK
MTYGFGFGAGLKALHAARLAIEVSGHNVANANTPGFARQRVLQSSTLPFGVMGGFQIGTGVQVDDVQRLVDDGLERRIRLQLGFSAGAEVDDARWHEIEGIFNEPSAGLSEGFAALFGGIGKLQTDAADRALRSGLVQSGRAVTQGFNHLASRLQELQGSSLREVSGLLRSVNEHAQAVALLNREIVSVEASGSTANDLRDAREQHVKELATLLDTEAVERGNGAVDLLVGGYMMVSGTHVTPLRVVKNGEGRSEIRIGDSTQAIQVREGRVAALLRHETTEIPAVLAKMDALAKSLALEFNRIHSTGVPATGSFTSLTSHYAAEDRDGDGQRGDELLGQAGFAFDMTPGDLWVSVTDKRTGDIERHRIGVDPASMTLDDLAAAIDAIDHLEADVDATGRLRLRADDGHGFDFAARLDAKPDAFGSFGGARPSFGTAQRGPFALAVPASFVVDASGTPHTVNLTAGDFANPGQATAEELAAAIDAQLGGDATARAVGGHLVIRANAGGPSATLQLTDGTGSPLAALGLPAGVSRSGQAEGVQVSINGQYTGGGNQKLVFRPDGDGQIGVTPNLTVGVFDEGGNRLTTLNVGLGVYSPGKDIAVVDGITVAFGPGQVSAGNGDVFALDALHDSDTTDVLVALGLNGFFVGSSAGTLGIDPSLEANPDLLAAGITGNAGDASNLARWAALRDSKLGALSDGSFEEFYGDVVGEVGFEAATATASLAAQDQVLQTLASQREAVSGVNLDEEMLNLVQYQQAFQAASRFINTVSDLTQVLIDMAR